MWDVLPGDWKHARRALLGLVLLVMCLGDTQATHADTYATADHPDAAIDATLASVFDIENQGMRGVGARSLARLTKVPLDNPLVLTGYNKSSLADLPEAKGGEQWECMTQALYFEARGETVTGQFAVAEVIMNRVKSARFPDTVCGVVHQGSGKRYECQFTFWCDGRAEVFANQNAYEEVGKVAKLVLSGIDLNLTGGATYYHTRSVKPTWSKVFLRTATIGYHHFYRRAPIQVSSN